MHGIFKPVILFLSILAFSLSFHACQESDEETSTNKEEESENPKTDGLGSPKTEEFDGGVITFQYNDGVMILDESTQSYLVKVEVDTVLYFSKSIPDELRPHTGKIMSSSIIEGKLPYGLGNKIISVTEEDGLYKCVTTSAPLNEIFKVLSLSADIELITDTISHPIEDVDGNICEVSVSKQNNTKATIGSPNLLTINIESGDAIYAAGSISLGAVATINLDLKQKKTELSLAIYTGINGEIGGKKDWEGYKKLLPKVGKWKIVTGVVSLGPVVLRPYIDAELGVRGSIKGTISTTFSKQFGIQFGIKDGNGFSQNLSDSNTDIIEGFSANVIGEVGLVTGFDFGIGLYTKNLAAGITNSVQAGVSTDFQLNNKDLFRNQPKLDFNITADANAFVVAQFLGKEFVHEQASLASINLFSHSWPLLPSLEENSLKITRRNETPSLMYDAEYELTGGLLNINGIASDVLSIIPAFRVYNEDTEVYHVIDDKQKISGSGKQKFSFGLTGLKEGVTYTGVPCLIIANHIYDEKGITFPSMCIDEGHPHTIDMGLPSETLWCCINAGASCPTDFGEYYLMSHAENVAAIMGEGYSTPTKEQFEELMAYTKQSHVVINKVKGILFEASNGNTIFLPAAAHLYWDGFENIWDINNEDSGAYWTVTQSADEDYYYFLEFSQAEDTPWFGNRDIDRNKLPIRPVYNKK